MGRFRLTKQAKILLVGIVVALLAALIFGAVKTGFVKNDIGGNSSSGDLVLNTSSDKDTINLSLDEWVGWSSIIIANGGATTQEGSIFDELGLKVNINIINDAELSSNALIKGDLNAAGYTINRVAFLSEKFANAKTEVVMPFITNYSNGGDGIIAKKEFQTVESLVNAKIGVPEFSEAHSLVVWFVNKSDLTQSQKDKIIDNLIMFETPDEAANAFFSGKIDVAATWEPYLSQAESGTNSHVLFSTASSSRLIMDGILFDAEWAEANPKLVQKFIDGTLQAKSLYKKDFDAVRDVMPMFATATDEEYISMANTANLAGWSENVELLDESAPIIFTDMCKIWNSIGEKTSNGMVVSLFDNSYVNALADKYSNVKDNSEKIEFTQADKDNAVNADALMTKSATINFVPDAAKFLDSAEATEVLDEFIEIAKVLDGTIIQIEGNIASDSAASEAGQKLSYNRANTVAKYFIANGIDADRIIVIGNGSTKQIGDNSTEAGKIQNRRTDVFFKTIEQ